MLKYKFKTFVCLKEAKENIEQPHVISADPPMKLPAGVDRLVEAFKRSKEVTLGKEVDSKSGGEKNITMKGKKLFIVGGAVRDYLIGHTPRDYNLATDAHPEEVEKICHNAKPPIQVVKKDVKNGIVKVSVDGEVYEIETMRVPNSDGNVFTANPQEDYGRRDFTANAMYYDPASKKIYDYAGGLRHLKDGAIKPLGNPEDFKQDGMRKYRYARMLNKIPNAKMDDSTKELISSSVDDDTNPEKIRDEFWRGLEDLHSDPTKFLKTYNDLGLLKNVFPKLELSLDFPNCKTCKSRPIVLASLLKNNKPEKLVSVLRELKYNDREIKDAVFLVNLLLFKPELVYDFKREMLSTSLTKRQIMDWASINKLDTEMIEKLVDHRFTVNASDIMDKEGLSGDQLKEKVKSLEVQAFLKAMNQ